MDYLKNTFKFNLPKRRTMLGLALIFVLTSNQVQAAEVKAYSAPSMSLFGMAQNDLDSTKRVGFKVPTGGNNELPMSSDQPSVRTYRVSMTAYNSEEGQTDSTPFIAADGTHVFDGMVAANFLKFKTRIRIPALYGNKVFIVHDRMNQRYTDRVDIWMEDHSDAVQFGVKRNIVIEVL